MRQKQSVDGSTIQWHGTEAGQPDWTDESRLVAFTLNGSGASGGRSDAQGLIRNLPDLPAEPDEE